MNSKYVLVDAELLDKLEFEVGDHLDENVDIGSNVSSKKENIRELITLVDRSKKDLLTKDDFKVIDAAMSDHIICMMDRSNPDEKDFARVSRVEDKLGELRDEIKY